LAAEATVVDGRLLQPAPRLLQPARHRRRRLLDPATIEII
jgi:hypothetical protein